MSQVMRKRYFTMKDIFSRKLPAWFVNAQGRKWIEIVEFFVMRYDKLTEETEEAVDLAYIELHSNMVDKDADEDAYMCLCGKVAFPKRFKWEVFNNRDIINIWMRTFDGKETIDPDHTFEDINLHFIVRFLLTVEC